MREETDCWPESLRADVTEAIRGFVAVEEPGLSCVHEFVVVRSVVVPELVTTEETSPVCQPLVKRFVVLVVPAVSVTAIEVVSPAVFVI